MTHANVSRSPSGGELPLVSFIVTYHNEPKAMLLACLESIRALPLAKGEREVIVVDDGTTLTDFPLKDGERLIPQEQAGLSVARNRGIESSCGRYIQFVDADDCLILPAYAAVLAQMRKGEADMVLFKASSHPSPEASPHPSPEGKGAFRGDTPHPFREGEGGKAAPPHKGDRGGSGLDGVFLLLHHNLRAAACCYTFRRSTLGSLRFHPGLYHEDELFTPQLFLKAERLVELKVKAYFYRQHAGTITHTKSPAKIRKRLDDIRFILKELHSLGTPVLSRRIRQLTVDYLQKTWTLTHSLRELRCRAKELRREGFLPLPLRTYSPRYLLACLLTRFLAF